MKPKLEEYKMLLTEDIFLLGYEPLRYSIFEGENSNRQDYQIRIEYVNCRYEVYLTADRASITGKYIYDNIFDAIEKFLNIMQSRILTNRMGVKNGEDPEYDCSLWGKEWIETNLKRGKNITLMFFLFFHFRKIVEDSTFSQVTRALFLKQMKPFLEKVVYTSKAFLERNFCKEDLIER